MTYQELKDQAARRAQQAQSWAEQGLTTLEIPFQPRGFWEVPIEKRKLRAQKLARVLKNNP